MVSMRMRVFSPLAHFLTCITSIAHVVSVSLQKAGNTALHKEKMANSANEVDDAHSFRVCGDEAFIAKNARGLI